MAKHTEYIGLIRYKGEPLKEGYLDARKSAEVLIGFDESLRYFIGKQDTELSKIDYEIPVKIQKGSWEALIPHDAAFWLRTALGIATAAYLTTAATKMAEKDFENASITVLFKKSMQAIQWVIRIGKHQGSLLKRKFDNLRWQSGTQEIGIPNDKGEYLFVPKIFLDYFEQIPATILRKLASIVTEDIKLEVVVHQDDEDVVESLEFTHKRIFCPDAEELLFPELKHGDVVKLSGLVTRGNENTNSIGFLYQGHILTCYPKDGSVVRFKPALYLNSEIIGTITRENEFGELTENKPKIIFTDLKPLEPDNPKESPPGLFDDEK
ncbi:MAG: hypothetical protein ABSG22_08145 [Sedimentisphaerales bacterium]|jgi:hypothetical protein